MIRAALLCIFLAPLAAAHQEPPIAQQNTDLTTRNEALIRFSSALKRFLNILENQNSTPETALQLTENAPLYRLQPSQVFSAFSQGSSQLGLLLPPAQQQILNAFSFVTAIAADLLKKDEQEQQYKKFLEFQAAQQNQEKSFCPQNETKTEILIVSLAMGSLSLDTLLARSPQLACTLLDKSLENITFLGDRAASNMKRLSYSNHAAAEVALAEVTFSIRELEKNMDFAGTPSEKPFGELKAAQSTEDHYSIIHKNISNPQVNEQFLKNVFEHITTSTKKIIQLSLNQMKAELK